MSEPRFNHVHSITIFSSRKLALRAAVFSLVMLGLSSIVAPTAVAGPDDINQQVEVIENAQSSVLGIINTNNSFVRCGPSADTYYPTMKLNKGAKITVVGMKGTWLKIVPPDGSFCYVSKAFVDRNGDGTSGKINHEGSTVRAGSTENTLKVVPLCQLSIGADVKIIGEQDEFYKITPPEGKAYVYIDRQFVDRDTEVKADGGNEAAKPGNGAGTGNTIAGAGTAGGSTGKIEMPKLDPITTGAGTSTGIGGAIAKIETPSKPEMPQFSNIPVPTTAESTGISSNTGTTIKSTTQPGDTSISGTGKSIDDPAMVEALYDKAEAEYAAITAKPLDQHLATPLQQEYEFLIATKKLPTSMDAIAHSRVETLKLRAVAAVKLADAKAAQVEPDKKQMSLVAEQKELQDAIVANGVVIYTALGELRSSSLQIGAKTLYRLTDPANGRTVCYIRTDDNKYAGMIGKFVGVKGDITTESQLSLKVIASPTDATVVETSKVHRGVTATVLPPSMMNPDNATTAAHTIDGK